MRRVLGAIVLAACGGSAATTPDAPPPDAPPPSRALERLDWTASRGAPLAASTAVVPGAAELFAVHGGGFVTRSACVDRAGCTLSWRDDAGAVTRERARMLGVTASVVAPDGRHALLLAADAVDTCGADQALVARGTLQLLDLATGDATFELALRSNLWDLDAFAPDGAWFLAAPIPDGACGTATFQHRATAPPFAPPPGMADDLDFIRFADGGHWFAYRGETVGVLDPGVAGSFTALGESQRFELRGGWLHAFLGYSDLAQQVLSIGPAGERRTTALRDEDWFPLDTWGRWARVCGYRQEDHRDCRVVDGLGAAAPVDFRITVAPDHPDDSVLVGAGGAVVFVGPTGAGDRAVQRIDLATGRRELLHAGDGRLRPLGDGAAALLVQGNSAWLIEADREELLADDVSHVLTTPAPRRRQPVRQDDLAVLALSTDGGSFTLRVLDLRTRRLATLSDRLYHAPRLDHPFAHDDCGQAWTARRAGAVGEGLLQDGRHLFFVEPQTETGPATMWVVPVDLSAPPRRVADLAGHPVGCHAPLASPDGARLAFAEDGFDGQTRITIARP